MKNANRIAYIMSRFPGLSETFILREMCEMENQGWKLELFPIIYQEEAVIHNEARSWIERARRPRVTEIISANVRLMFTRPLLYFLVFLKIVLGNILSLKFLIRAVALFPKAVWMARQMAAEKITHIHAHYATHPALAAWVINQISGIPYSITVHAHDIFVNKSMLRRKLLDARYIVAISNYNREYLINLFGAWVGEKTDVIHCGVIPEKYVHVSTSASKKTSGRFAILSIGSLRPYKGFNYLLGACEILKARGFLFRCRIIGGGELSDSLHTIINELKLADYVELLGPKNQNEVADLLGGASCYVQPSIITPAGKMEGIPVSLMEAMASGLPVIATKISGVPELVKHGETGWLVQPENPGALADAILSVYNDPVEAGRRGQAGRELVLREFNISSNVAKFSTLLGLSIDDMAWK